MRNDVQLVLGILFLLAYQGFELGVSNAPLGVARKFVKLGFRVTAVVLSFFKRDHWTTKASITSSRSLAGLQYLLHGLNQNLATTPDCVEKGEFSTQDLENLRKRTILPKLLYGIAPERGVSDASKDFGQGSLWVDIGKDEDMDIPVIIYIHGFMGVVSGSPDAEAGFAYKLSKASGYRVLMLGLPLMPEHKAEDAANLVLEAVGKLKKQNPDRAVILFSVSAGGYVLSRALFSLRDKKPKDIVCSVFVSPVVGGGDSRESYKSEKEASFPLSWVKCLHHLQKWSALKQRWNGMQPIYIQTSAGEVARDQAAGLKNLIKKGGGEVFWDEIHNAPHAVALFNDYCEEGNVALQRISDWIKLKVRKSAY